MSRSTVHAVDVVTFNFGGIDLTDGLGADGFLKITQPDENWTYTPGIGGEGCFNHKPTGAVEIEASYLQNSATNAKLSAYHLASEAAGGLPAPIFYEDRKGTSKLAGTDAVLAKMADQEEGAEQKDVTWKFIVHQPARFVGSH